MKQSTVFEAAPFCLDYLDMCGHWQSEERHGRHIAVIVMPLIALIEDRKSSLQRRGIASIYLGGENHDLDMKTFRDDPAAVQHVFASPETMLSHKGRSFLVEFSSQICGIFVDEAHCISMW